LQAYQSTRGRLYLVFEYVEHTFHGLLKAYPLGLDPDQVKSATWQLLKALRYTHKNNVSATTVIILTEMSKLSAS
jgi:serine/threonine protein kinase